MPQRPMDPAPQFTFLEVYRNIASLPNHQVTGLRTTGGVPFEAEAKVTGDGRNFISLPHNNRIYAEDWGYMTNSMGQDGQRIGHYARPLDEWLADNM